MIRTPNVVTEDNGSLLKAIARECRFGHCRHPECRGRVDRIFRRLEAARLKELAEVEPEDSGSGYTPAEMAAMWKDHMREQRGFRRVRSRRPRRIKPVGNNQRVRQTSGPIVVILRDDGTLDKNAMRDRRWFGAPVYS